MGGNGPTKNHPDPLTADIYCVRQSTGRKRPKPRDEPNKTISKKKRISIENEAAHALLQLQTSDVNQETIQSENDVSMCDKTETKSASNIEVTSDHIEITSKHISCPSCKASFELSDEEQKRVLRAQFIHTILGNNSTCFHYTGIPKSKTLKDIFKWLEPCAKELKLWDGKNKLVPERNVRGRKRKITTLFEEMILTLVRIRRGYDNEHLALLFGISTSHVSRICITWTNFLAKCFENLIKWPSKELVSGNLPDTFGAYPRTRVIIDCTELKIQKPYRPFAQKMTWSNYKHANTCKLLVGIMPSGAITFRSKVYNRNVSDVAIVDLSGFPNVIQAGDDVMADRGFNIRHMLLPKHATLNIPAFSHGRQLSAKAVSRSRKIARVRIHVERAIARMKTFKIISGILPLRLRFQLNQIITIIIVLCNLQGRLC